MNKVLENKYILVVKSNLPNRDTAYLFEGGDADCIESPGGFMWALYENDLNELIENSKEIGALQILYTYKERLNAKIVLSNDFWIEYFVMEVVDPFTRCDAWGNEY